MDDFSFFGPNIPEEVKKSIPSLNKLTPQQLRHIATAVLQFLAEPSAINEEKFAALQKDAEIDASTTTLIFTSILFIFRAALRTRIKSNQMQAGLDELRINKPLVSQLVSMFAKSQEHLEKQAPEMTLKFPSLDGFRWRIDVALTSSNMGLVLKPAILVEWTLSTGKVYLFELNLDRFHQLRYNTSKVLKDMQDLEKLAILKIDK